MLLVRLVLLQGERRRRVSFHRLADFLCCRCCCCDVVVLLNVLLGAGAACCICCMIVLLLDNVAACLYHLLVKCRVSALCVRSRKNTRKKKAILPNRCATMFKQSCHSSTLAATYHTHVHRHDTPPATRPHNPCVQKKNQVPLPNSLPQAPPLPQPAPPLPPRPPHQRARHC